AVATAALDPEPGTGARLVPQLTSMYVVAAVEHTLDARARQEAVDENALADDLRRRIARALADPIASTPVAAAELLFAEASMSRLRRGDASAFGRAADAAERAGDRWLAASARAQ